MKRYEACILSAHENYIDTRLKAYQDEGWEIAGAMSVQLNTNGDSRFLLIPMKRPVKATPKQIKKKV